MKNTHVLILTAFAALVAAVAPLIAQDGRPLGTMPHGTYQCALPGDADGQAYEVVAEAGFVIAPASRYRTAAGEGTYLMRGRELVFTSGPKKGEEYRRVGANQLQLMSGDGTLDRLLCTRLGATG